jgi:predicted MFS family arabinose efflux permease
MNGNTAAPAPVEFTPYQKFVTRMLAFLQFTIVLDFMIMSPLGALLIRDLHLQPHQFALVVSVYAFAAGLSGFVSASFADKFDRKKMLLFFYVGFMVGTLLCGLAPTYRFLLFARVVTGIFGGVIGSISMAIIADLFPFQQRGRVMGVVQTAFGASQVLGLPIGFFLATHLGWHAPFLLLVGLTAIAGVLILVKLQPITEHLKLERDASPLRHLLHTVSDRRYVKAFFTTAFLATGGFMLMPFASAFTLNNLGISPNGVSWNYFVTGVATIIAGPLVGRLSDRWGKYKLFVVGSTLTAITVVFYTHLGHIPLGLLMVVSSIMFIGVTSRMISASALMSAVPSPESRGAFMSVNTSLQQISGGIGAYIAGLIVVQTPSGALARYDVLGYVVCAAMLLVVVMLRSIDRMVAANPR